MANYDYNTGIPNGPNNPSDDQPLMLINTNSIPGLVAEDHNGFGINNGGFHTVIRSDTQGRVWDPTASTGQPAALPGFEKTFAMNWTPDATNGTIDTQLFSLTGAGTISALTGDFSTYEGYQWIGGVLIQWGRVFAPFPGPTPGITGDFGSAAASGTVVFKDRDTTLKCIPFPKNLFTVYTQLLTFPSFGIGGTGLPCLTVQIGSGTTPADFAMNKTQFSWNFKNPSFDVASRTIQGFNWVAIGN